MYMSKSHPYSQRQRVQFSHAYSVSRNIKCCGKPAAACFLSTLSLHWSISTSPTHKWQLCICKLLLRHTEMRIPILLQCHITEGSSGMLGLHFWTADLTGKLCRLFDGVCMCVEWIFWIFSPDMTHIDGLCNPYRYIPGKHEYQATFSTPIWPGNELGSKM